MTTLVFIHGNKSTKASFNFISSHLNDNSHRKIYLSYNSDNGFYNNLDGMKDSLQGINDIFFITHSLGGIYALHLSEYFEGKVEGCVSIAAPFGGSDAATTLGLFFPDQVFRDIGPYSSPIIKGASVRLNIPWTAIVTISGNSSMMKQANDGILTTDSMSSRKDVLYDYQSFNHSEILMSNQVITTIKHSIAHSYEWGMHE